MEREAIRARPVAPRAAAWAVALGLGLAAATGVAAGPAAAQQHGGGDAAGAAPEHGRPVPAEGVGDAVAEHGQDVSPMPQLNARTYAGQIFWLAVSFGLLYWLLSRKALPRVTEILDTRRERIAGDLDRAARARAEAEAALRAYEGALAGARAEAAASMKDASDRLAADVAGRQRRLDADLQRRVGEAEARVRAAREAAMAGIAAVAAEAAQAAVARLAGLEVTAAEARRAVDAAAAGAATAGAR